MNLSKCWHGGIIDIAGKYYTASDGTEGFVYREVKRVRGAWRIVFRGTKGRIEDLR